jgi:hypothetical protein
MNMTDFTHYTLPKLYVQQVSPCQRGLKVSTPTGVIVTQALTLSSILLALYDHVMDFKQQFPLMALRAYHSLQFREQVRILSSHPLLLIQRNRLQHH